MLITQCLCGRNDGKREEHSGVRAIRCACGVARLDSEEKPDTYEEQYESGHYHESTSRHEHCVPYAARYEHDWQIAKLRIERYRSMLNGQWRGPMHSLDVGCANGAFVDYCASVGLDAYGIDPKPQRVLTGSLAKPPTALLDRHFELITYHDVLEHVLDPLAELRRARELLTVGGAIIIDVPDVGNPKGEHHWKIEHVWYFTEDSLVALLLRAKLTPLRVDRPIPGKLVVYGVRT